MTTNKVKKVNKYRGQTTHGGGHRKKRRGAGSRGGRGNAGTGKKAGQKKAGMKDRVLGSIGFTSHSRNKSKGLNVSYFTEVKLNKLLTAGKIVKEGDFYTVDLAKLGYNRLLGSGNTSLKLKVQVKYATPSAIEKIAAAGGEIISGETEATEE